MPHKGGNKNRHGRVNLPWRTLLLALLAGLAYIFAGPAPEAWVYSREAISRGDWWTLITGHWMHSDREHAIWNISALLILGSIFEQQLKNRIFIDLLFASLILSLWITIRMPDLLAYCGLSGILNTLLVTGTLGVWRRCRNASLLMILALTLIKNLVELSTHEALFTNSAWPSVPEAHLVGMATGILIVIFRDRVTGQTPSTPITARPG